MRYNKKLAARCMASVLVGTTVLSAGAQAAWAAGTPSDKEEVVYANLNGNGEVTGVYVVNSFAGGDITDYGTYTNIRNLTTTDEINTDGDEITLHTDADKIYYQGDLAGTDIPWDIEIHYYMDDTEYTPEEIAGMSGALKITISITQNKACDASFWEGYALQATLSLDTKNCKNIEAEDATIANVGSDKQLSYIILPNKGAELTVTADVTDFEMDAISINGMQLSMNIDLEDSDLTDQFAEVEDAIAKLDDGAGDLNDGAGDLDDGAAKLDSGVSEVNTGVVQLYDGVGQVDDGAGELNSGAKSLYDGSVTLNAGAKDLNDGATSLNSGIAKIQKALNKLNGKSEKLTKGSAKVLTALETIQTSLNGVSMNAEELKILSEASTQVAGGIANLVTGLQTIDGGIDQYYDALAQGGLTDVNSLISSNETALAALGITSTQREVYAAAAGGNTAIIAKLQELAAAGDTTAAALITDYMNTGDTTAISNYVTTAGTLIQVETLLKADMAYIQGSNTLISQIDGALDSQNGDLMTGALALQMKYAEFDTNVQGMVQTLNSLASNLSDLKSGIDTLVTEYKPLDTGIQEYTAAVADIEDGYQKVYNGSAKVASGASDLYAGTQTLTSGANDLYTGATELKSGTAELRSGTSELKNGVAELKNGTSDLKDGTTELLNGTSDLLDGTRQFREETNGMDTKVSDKITEKVDEMTGKDVETVSFVSEKNTNIQSVLFVLQTEAIEIPEEAETVAEEEENVSVWDKFLNLFR